MGGHDTQQVGMFGYIPLDATIPRYHPPRPIRQMVDAIWEAAEALTLPVSPTSVR